MLYIFILLITCNIPKHWRNIWLISYFPSFLDSGSVLGWVGCGLVIMYVLFAFTDHVPVQQYRLFYRSYTAEEGLHNFLGWRQHQVVLEYTWPQSCNNTQICDLGEWTISMRRLGRSPGTRTIGRIPKLGTSSIVNRRRVQTPSKCACPKISTRSSDATILVACATPPVSDKASQNLASL